MTKTTANEQTILEALADGTFLSVTELFSSGRLPAERSAQGVHETASRLARKGLVDKSRHHNRVFLQITDAGRERVEGVDSEPDLGGAVLMRGVSFRVESVPATPQDRAVLTAVDKTWAKIQEQWLASWEKNPTRAVPGVTFDLTPGRSSSCTSVGWDLRPAVELNLAPDGRVVTGADVLTYLLHQAGHSVIDPAAGQEGRAHSLAYRETAERLGLEVAKDATGYGDTSLAPGTRSRYRAELDALDRALAKWAPAEVARGERSARNGVVLMCSCEPPRKIRLRGNPDTINVSGIRCEICQSEFKLG